MRFELPDELCTEEAAAQLESGLKALDGVYRVIVYRRNRKLSIRYMDTVCSVHDVVLGLDRLVERIARERRPIRERLRSIGWTQRLRKRYRHAKTTAATLGHVVRSQLKRPTSAPMSTEKLIINFLNDIATFYLIKVHWSRISQQWLKEPIKYRYQWLTVFYLVFLMVRYRKAGNSK